ncbi:ZIP family metal transporter [Candidatus Saccharibacteria bacterium]|nr:ZIP family metal transporter [Candidatus Saccharibacteria bacterium]
MSDLILVILFSLIGGLFSLVGGILLLSSKKHAKKLAAYATPFAAGALLSAAFVDLLGEVSHNGDIELALNFTMVGILVFFFLERFLRWFHHHHDDEDGQRHDHNHADTNLPLVIIGDTVHNFIDGIAIAASFLISPSTGMITTLAVAAHEIPQEIGDFGLMLHKGLSRKKVLMVNVISSLATVVAAVTFYKFGQGANVPIDPILGLVAGFFIYVAVSDIIPTIHQTKNNRIAAKQSLLLLAGVIIVTAATRLLHGIVQ